MKDKSLGLETKGAETLGHVSVAYKILELVSSRSCLSLIFLRHSRPSFVSFASILLSLVLVSS